MFKRVLMGGRYNRPGRHTTPSGHQLQTTEPGGAKVRSTQLTGERVGSLHCFPSGHIVQLSCSAKRCVVTLMSYYVTMVSSYYVPLVTLLLCHHGYVLLCHLGPW